MAVRPPTPRQPDENAAGALSVDELRDELRLLEEDIASAEQTAAELRRLIGERSTGATDREEMSQLITEKDAHDAVLRILAARRERLQKRLTEAG